MKIEKLTDEQEKAIETWKEQGLSIGLSTEDSYTHEEKTLLINSLYTNFLEKKTVPVFSARGLDEAWQIVKLFSQLPDLLSKTNQENVLEVLRENRKKLRDVKYVSPYIQGSFDSYWVNYYDYWIKNEIIKIDEKLKYNCNLLQEITKAMQAVFPLDDFCVVCQKPITINMVNGQLHCDGGPSVEYADGFKVWSLNGVRVGQYLAETPSGQLDIQYYNKEKNADIRTEFVRKYGVDRMLDLGSKVDDYTNYDNVKYAESQYELYDMESLFEGVDYAPHLKMTNQSTGVFHVEAVSPDCRTLEDALRFRLGGLNPRHIGTVK